MSGDKKTRKWCKLFRDSSLGEREDCFIKLLEFRQTALWKPAEGFAFHTPVIIKIAFWAVIFFMVAAIRIPVYSENLNVVNGQSNTLITSYDKERQAIFTTDGNLVHVQGKFTGDRVEDFYISTSAMRSIKQSFNVKEDGEFSGYYGGVPIEKTSFVVLKFKSGLYLMYRIDYDNSWFFSVNGLDKSTADNVENYFTATEEESANYVTADLDLDRTRQTLEKLRTLALEITKGADDDYQKAKLISSWVSQNIYYDMDARETNVDLETISLEHILETNRTVCIGFANFYSALLEAVGIKSVNISGGVVFSGKCTYEELPYKTVAHQWVAFWYEKENRWVYTDPTHDSGNTYRSGRYNYVKSAMKFFDIDGAAFSLSHRGDKAELREYFSAEEFILNSDPGAGAEETQAETDNITTFEETTTEQIISQVEIPENAEIDDYSPPKPIDNTILYIVIAILALGILIIIITIIKSLVKR